MRSLNGGPVFLELFLAGLGGPLAALEPWVMARLARLIEETDLAPGGELFGLHACPDQFFVVRDGEVALLEDGRPPEIVRGPRALGLLDALAERPHTRSARAVGPVRLLRIPVDGFLELLEDSFDLARIVILRLARALSFLEDARRPEGHGQPARPFGFASGRLDPLERLAVLMKVFPLRGSGAQALSDLAAMTEEAWFETGMPLWEEPPPPGRIFVLFEGKVGARLRHEDAPGVTVEGGAGAVIGGVGAFAGRGDEWEARALAPSRALSFTVDDWTDVLEENFEMVRGTLASLAVAYGRSGVSL